MKAPETITTARLVLRRPRAGDAAAIFARYAAHAEVTRYLAWATHRSIADTEAFLAFSDAEWARAPAGPYLICLASGALIGSTGLGFETPERASTGYVLARDAWGSGYATEALRAIVALALPLGLQRLEAHCHVDHAASHRVLEKCGFAREKRIAQHTEFPNLATGKRLDVLAYVRVFGEWRGGTRISLKKKPSAR